MPGEKYPCAGPALPAPRLCFNTLQDQQGFKQPPSSSRADPSIGPDFLGFSTDGEMLPVGMPA
jgi:hypothetical protein